MTVSSTDTPAAETGASKTPAEDTSKVTATDVKDTAAPSTTDAPAKAGKGDKPKDMLTAVKAALSKTEKAPASEEKKEPKSEDAKPGDAKKEGEEGEGDEDDLTDEELTRLKPKTKKRIDTLLADRATRDQQIEALKPKAEQFDKLVTWVREADLNSNEVNDLFAIGKDLKSGNLRGAYDRIKPVFDSLQQALGHVLPTDLETRVKQGEISDADARALAKARADAVVANTNAERTRAASDKRAQESQSQTHIAAVQGAVTEWETSKEKADPDWKLKQPQVMREIKLAIHEQGYPKTTADAVKIADAALAEVEKTFSRLTPQRREVKPVTDVSASSRAATAPKTMLEAARRGLAKTG